MNSIRVAHVVTHPVPYFAPLYRELARRAEIDLTVFFYSDASIGPYWDHEFDRTVDWDVSLLDGYRSRFTPSSVGRELSRRIHTRPQWDVVSEVLSGSYDVIWGHGYPYLTTWLLAMGGRLRGIPFVLREEQTFARQRSIGRRLSKWAVLRTMLGGKRSVGLYIGEQNRPFLAHYGLPPERLIRAAYCVDNEFFESQRVSLDGRRPVLRQSFGISDDAPVFLCCAKLIERKAPFDLIEAFARLRSGQPCWLLMVGDGHLLAAAEQIVAERGIQGVRFAGFLNQGKVGEAYAAADVFVLPSAYETWGLVVNEALCFGLPCIVSDHVGCAPDLVHPEENGLVTPVGDTALLARAMKRLADDEELRRRFGARSMEIVSRYSIESCADGIVRGCVAAASAARR